MGNPHPTKSKPIKIGRKHTGQRSEKWLQKKRNATRVTEKSRDYQATTYKMKVADYFSGRSDTHPYPVTRPSNRR